MIFSCAHRTCIKVQHAANQVRQTWRIKMGLELWAPSSLWTWTCEMNPGDFDKMRRRWDTCRLCEPCEPSPGGLQTPRLTGPHIQSHGKKKQTLEGRCWHILQELWPFETCDFSFFVKNTSTDSTGSLLNLCRQLQGCWDWLSDSHFIVILCVCGRVRTLTADLDIMPLWSNARVTESVSSQHAGKLKWWANGCDTATKAPRPLSFYWWFSVAGWAVNATFTQKEWRWRLPPWLCGDSLHCHHYSVKALHVGLPHACTSTRPSSSVSLARSELWPVGFS